MTTIIHYSHFAQQPGVELACGRSTTPAWGDGTTEHDGVYRDDDGDCYTFRRVSLVNCEGCKHYIAARSARPAQDPLGAFLAAYDDYLDGKLAYRDLPTQIYRADKLHDEIRERYFADAITAERAVELRWLVRLGEWQRRPWWDRLITRLLGGGP